MHEIKFRAWYTDTKNFDDKILDFATIDWWSFGQKQPTVVWQQFTGLKDKNGVEIYEGDIVQWRRNPAPVTYEPGGFKLKVETVDAEHALAMVQFKTLIQEECEVIGNIYENSELLK